METPMCPLHKKVMTLKPAGISKSGKHYPPFWSCGEKINDKQWCPYKPPEGTPTEGRPVAEAQFNQDLKDSSIGKMYAEKTENIKLLNAINNSVALVVAMIEAKIWPEVNEEWIKSKVEEYKNWFLDKLK